MSSTESFDLAGLGSIRAAERALLSLYLPAEGGWQALAARLDADRTLLASAPEEAAEFERNLRLAHAWWEAHAPPSGTVGLFVSSALGVLEAVHVPLRLPATARLDSAPFVAPLAELREGYEHLAVVLAEEDLTRIYLISARAEGGPIALWAALLDGGWSELRYRRSLGSAPTPEDAREVGRALLRLDAERDFERVVLMGRPATLRAIRGVLPAAIGHKTVESEALTVGAPAGLVPKDRPGERGLWARIRETYLRGGLAAVGVDAVADAAAEGRIERAVVCRSCDFDGARCRTCEHLMMGERATCAECGGQDLLAVGLVNECVEMVLRGSAEVDFVDADHALSRLGGIAALLRY